MLFSVCIPVYNASHFLERCLRSILDQPFDDYELVLVDDGSTDDSLALCRKFAERFSRIHVLQQANAGPAAARNAAIDIAQGEYLLFVDADDWVFPDYFAALAKAIQYQSRRGSYVRTSPAAMLRSPKEIFNFLEYQFCKELADCNETLPYSSNCDTHSCWNKAFSRRLIEETRFPLGTVVEEDLRFNLRLLEKTQSIVILPDVLYCYQQQDAGSVTTQYNPRKFSSKIEAYREEIAFAERIQSPAIANFFQDSLLSYVSSCINNLCYPNCPLSKKEKNAAIREYFAASEVQQAVQVCRPRSLRTRIMRQLINHNLVRISWMIHRMGRVLR